MGFDKLSPNGVWGAKLKPLSHRTNQVRACRYRSFFSVTGPKKRARTPSRRHGGQAVLFARVALDALHSFLCEAQGVCMNVWVVDGKPACL